MCCFVVRKSKNAAKKEGYSQPDTAEENLSWRDNEVELLLVVVRAYSSQKDSEGLEWENIKSKYEDIRTYKEHKEEVQKSSRLR